MDKRNQIVLGIIIFLIGIFLFMQKNILSYSSLIFVFVGVAFMLLYIMKRKSWALIIGMYVTWIALTNFIYEYWGYQISFTMNYSMVFIVTAFIFYILFYSKNKTGLLLPANILFWLGVNNILGSVASLPFYNMPGLLFMFCIAMAFFSTYFLGRGVFGRWTLYIGSVFIVIGCCFSFGYGDILFGIRNLAAFMFLAASIIIILRAVRK